MYVKLDILYEDDHIIVINKPAGLLTVPDRYQQSKTNLLRILNMDRETLLVHRLDKDTSGVICFARSSDALTSLSQQFESRTAVKEYSLLVHGNPPQTGQIDQPIALHPKLPKMHVHKKGKPAQTSFEVIESFNRYSFVKAVLHTGRTHQIRVHFEYIQYPLLVDPLYGKKQAFYLSEIKRYYRFKEDQEERPLISRVSLHSAKLKILHPITGVELTCEAKLPKDMKAVLHQLRKNN